MKEVASNTGPRARVTNPSHAVRTGAGSGRAAVVGERFQLLVTCRDEADQRRLFEWLASKGYTPRVLVL